MPEGSPHALPPSVHIQTLILDGLGAHSSAAIRDGFHQAWKQARGSDWETLPPDAFRGELELQVHPGLSSRELGTRLAQALIRHARRSPAAAPNRPLA